MTYNKRAAEYHSEKLYHDVNQQQSLNKDIKYKSVMHIVENDGLMYPPDYWRTMV